MPLHGWLHGWDMARIGWGWRAVLLGVGLSACAGDDPGPQAAAPAWMGAPVGGGASGVSSPAPGSDSDSVTLVDPGATESAAAPAVQTVPGNAAGEGAGCAAPGADADGDGRLDCEDACPNDPLKTEPGVCGCGQADPPPGAPGTCSPSPADPANPAQPAEADADGSSEGAQTPDLAPQMPDLPGPMSDEPPSTPNDTLNAPEDPGAEAPEGEELCNVQPIPDTLRSDHDLDDVYTRYASARGVPVLASDSPQDEALRRACMWVRDLSARPDILEAMLDRKIGLVVMGLDETSADFPEFAAWGVPDSRARGLGGVPRGLCAEENIMCNRGRDRWRGESICVHEFAHTMHLGVYNLMDRGFNGRVRDAYRAATSAGKYRSTYAARNATEYFAEGVQDWYNTNLESPRPDGVHNEINTRKELEEYDPGLYSILAEVLPDEPEYRDCYYYE